MSAVAPPPIGVGSIVRVPDVMVSDGSNFLEGVVADVAFDGVATVTVVFPNTAARTVTMDQVVPVGLETSTPLRTFVAAIMAATTAPRKSDSVPEAEPEPEAEPPIETLLGDGGGVETKKLRAECAALRAALKKSEAARIDSTKMVTELKTKFEKIVAEIIAENKTLVKAAENSVVAGYREAPSRFSARGTDVDGRVSAAGSFRSGPGNTAGAGGVGVQPNRYGLAADLPGGAVDKQLNVQQWQIPKVTGD